MKRFPFKILLINFCVLLAILIAIDVIWNIFSSTDFELRKAELFRPWRLPVTQMDDIQNPLFAGFVAHPLFGYTLNPTFGSNNMGFDHPEPFPLEKKPDEFNVGLFGGSVMQGLARVFLELNQENARLTVKVCGAPKKVKFINYALGAYRQPQQFNVFHYFADTVDLTVNVDGYNEVLLEPPPIFPDAYPGLTRELYFMNNRKIVAFYKDFISRKLEFSVLKFFSANPFLLKSSLLFTSASKIVNYLEADSSDAPYLEYNEVPAAKRTSNSRKERANALAALWEKYTAFQYNLANLTHVKSIFIIQPTQYLPGAKDFTPEEKQIALVRNKDEMEFRTATLEKLVQSAEKLKKSGLPVYNFTKIFATESRPIFIDDMCHINRLGNEVLRDRIINLIREQASRIKCK